MNKGKFHIGIIDVTKNEPTLPADVRLPDDIGRVTGLFFTISPAYTGYADTPALGIISISLDNGLSNIINEIEVNTTTRLPGGIIPVDETIRKNTFARVFYKDLGIPAVQDEYRVKIYFMYEKRK